MGVATLQNNMRSFQVKASSLSRRGFTVFTLAILAALACEWFVGQFVNINILVLITYVFYLWVLYARDRRFILEFFWLITMATLNIVGTFCCDEGLFLAELEHLSWYICAVSPLVALYVLLFFSIEFYRLGRQWEPRFVEMSSPGEITKLQFALTIGALIAFYLFLQVARNPYFAVGVLRLDYASQYMSSLSVSLRTYLPFFLPVAVMSWRAGNRVLPCVFLVLTFGFYVLEGDKFGTLFFAAYILALAAMPSISDTGVDRIIKVLFIFFWILIGVVYVQRILIFDNTFTEFLDVLSQRLAQQGEVWWSVYRQAGGLTLTGNDISGEVNAILQPGIQDGRMFGQWQMMRVACGFSAYSSYRVAASIPFTATTTASLIYYFGYFGAVVFYVGIGFVYAALIRNASLAFSAKRILESMVYVKLISIFGSVLFSSDLTYLLSIRGAFYLGVLFLLTLLRERRERDKMSLASRRKILYARNETVEL